MFFLYQTNIQKEKRNRKVILYEWKKSRNKDFFENIEYRALWKCRNFGQNSKKHGGYLTNFLYML